jgi:hypothetical protein
MDGTEVACLAGWPRLRRSLRRRRASFFYFQQSAYVVGREQVEIPVVVLCRIWSAVSLVPVSPCVDGHGPADHGSASRSICLSATWSMEWRVLVGSGGAYVLLCSMAVR